MKELLKLMEDGRAWSVEELAIERNTTPDKIKRQMEFLEHNGFLHKVSSCGHESGHDCSGCSAHCSSETKFTGAPVFWELVKR